MDKGQTASNTRLHVVYCVVVILVALGSSLVTLQFASHSASEEAIYLVGAVTITDPQRLPEYQAISGPLAAQLGGYKPLAFSTPQLLEGDLPAQALYFIERYDSQQGLLSFINSAEFLEAKKLRDQVADVHFMMWLPALPADALPH